MRRGRVEHDHEQRRAPQTERGAAGLRQTGQAAGGNQPRIFEQLEPARLLERRQRRPAASISLGSIINAQASDLRASSCRPMRISQRGDSGTQ